MFRSLTIFAVSGALLLAACGSNLPESANGLPPGDATHGADLFHQSISGAPPCSNCHTVDGSTLVGPSFKGFGTVANTRIDGLSANEYVFQSITHPSSYLVTGYGNLMYNQYAQRLNSQQIADLTVFLLSR